MRTLHEQYLLKQEAITQRLQDFSRRSEEDIFYELCFCLLTPQSKGKMCWERVERLKKRNFKERPINPHSSISDLRFHNHKHQYLLAAKRQFSQILEQLSKERDPYHLREWLANNVQGYGYKESSHFLRNIGYRHLAILDRHILKNLVKHKVIHTPPKTLTKKKYLEIEQQFLHFSEKINIPLDALDLLFWSNETGAIFK